MSSPKTAKIAGSSLWLTGSFAVTKVSQLIAQIILARLLSPKDFGIWGMVLIVTTLSELFKDSAIASVLIYKGLSDKKLANAVYSVGVNISVCMFFVQMLVGFPLSQFFHQPIVFPLIVCESLVFLIGAGRGSHAAVLQRQMNFRAIAISDSVVKLVGFSIVISCAVIGWGVWSFVVGNIAMTAVDALIKRWFSGYRFTYHFIPDASAVQEVRGYITSLVGINLAVYVNTNTDNLIVGRLLGAQALGFYSLGYQLAMLPTFALSQINRVNFSVLSQKDNEGKRVYVCKMLELYALFYAPIYGVAFVMAPWLIPLVYGAEWTKAAPIFQIVLIFAYARGFMAILGTALNTLDKPHINAAINWVLVPLSISGFLVGAYLGGVNGVAIATALVMGIAATVWFWIAICYSTGWSIRVLLAPVLLPTITIGLILVALLATPIPTHLAPYLQPLAIILGYGIIISLVSKGRVPQMLIDLVRRTLK
ncbi:MAG: oligosaccharide flippase family protein [Cyanomargarita calcarea GSE-NOS-MK-12-04C]|jgi:O-antigen/teichoic acid export membrane protein|uniref:Oligosaccharide flippase family protein n=1 Tax=Cyanomargarita calcarea GSE-NOS-MK-12-04C TaxID=2839659 RepID=A0A951UVG3_9CYAN|nr:oligosaccharide flippase family protein [Cyanomargarita calcarea GSE-NOS-MK-12-04C]